MNKQEAIEIVESRAFNIGDIDLACGLSYTKHIINQIDEPQKVVVPKFVAEWIKELKKSHSNLAWVWQVYPNETKIKNWLESNTEKFMRAWLDGYEIEQEKLYTVEIPNPNRTSVSYTYTLYKKADGKIIIIGAGDDYEKRKECQLTESEIKQDFEWAWDAGFAKEVEK